MNTKRAALWALVLPNLMLSRQGRRNGWTLWHVVGAYVMIALGALVTWEAWADIFHIARVDEESSHIYLVPPIVAWLLYVRRERLRYCRPTGQWIGPVVIAAGWAIASYGYYNSMQSLWHAGSVMVVAGCLLTVLGADVFRRFFPAFAVLMFLVPVPGMLRQPLALWLQNGLTWMTGIFFNIIGQDVQAFGNTLTINGKPVQVAEACNGMRMVFTLMMVCIAVGFGTPLKWYVQVLLVPLSIPIALLCNFVRVVPTVWLFGYASSDVALTFHDIAGWVMIVVGFLLSLGIIQMLRWAMLPVARYTLAYD